MISGLPSAEIRTVPFVMKRQPISFQSALVISLRERNTFPVHAGSDSVDMPDIISGIPPGIFSLNEGPGAVYLFGNDNV